MTPAVAHDPGGKVATPVPAGWHSEAVFSRCRRYRYVLRRRYMLGASQRSGFLLWLMCNPSTATEHVDDPTLRRVRTFTVREGYGEFTVCNVLADRCTNPKRLGETIDQDAIWINLYHIQTQRLGCVGLVAAWGRALPRRFEMLTHAALNAAGNGVPILCLGKTRDGTPRHPLMVRADAPLVAYR